MIEVEMFVDTYGDEFLKITLKRFDQDAVLAITSIAGWFKGKEPFVYGLPLQALGEFVKKTEDMLVIWKSTVDNMGTVAKGIDTREIPSDYIIEYEPKLPLRPHQIKGFNLFMMRDHLLVADQEGTGNLQPN